MSVPLDSPPYAHLRQLHTRWHTHPVSFSFDFESMKIVQRMLIFRKEGMVENNESSLPSQCWQKAAIPWFPASDAESSPHLNILSVIQRESLPLGCATQAPFLPTAGFLDSLGIDSHDNQRPHVHWSICRINARDLSLPAGSQEMRPITGRYRTGPA